MASIVALMQAGMGTKDVTKKLNVCPRTVYNTTKCYTMKSTSMFQDLECPICAKKLTSSGSGCNRITKEHEGNYKGTQYLANHHDEDC